MSSETSCLNGKHAWGFPEERLFFNESANIGLSKTNLKFVRAYKILNGASYLLSPLAGIARILTVIAQYIIFRKGHMDEVDQDKEIKGLKQFMAMEAGRGVMEIFCFGYFLWAVDIGATFHHKHSPSYASNI